MAKRQAKNLLHQLKRFDARADYPVLSLYLSADKPGELTPKLLKSQFHSLRHTQLTAQQKEIFVSDLQKIEAFLAGYAGMSGCALAIFSAGDALWEVIELDHATEPHLSVHQKPYLKPLEQALQQEENYVVLLLNRKRARLLNIQMGEVADNLEISNPEHIPEVKLARHEGLLGGQDKASRHAQKYFTQFLREVARATSRFARRTNAKFVIIGGHKEMHGKLRESLPKRLQAMVRGEVVALPDMPTPMVLDRSRSLVAGTGRAA